MPRLRVFAGLAPGCGRRERSGLHLRQLGQRETVDRRGCKWNGFADEERLDARMVQIGLVG